eukprot:7210656-Prymnesium_polylepis.2
MGHGGREQVASGTRCTWVNRTAGCTRFSPDVRRLQRATSKPFTDPSLHPRLCTVRAPVPRLRGYMVVSSNCHRECSGLVAQPKIPVRPILLIVERNRRLALAPLRLRRRA